MAASQQLRCAIRAFAMTPETQTYALAWRIQAEVVMYSMN